MTGKKTVKEAAKEFMLHWGTGAGDGVVTYEEFEEHYKGGLHLCLYLYLLRQLYCNSSSFTILLCIQKLFELLSLSLFLC